MNFRGIKIQRLLLRGVVTASNSAWAGAVAAGILGGLVVLSMAAQSGGDAMKQSKGQDPAAPTITERGAEGAQTTEAPAGQQAVDTAEAERKKGIAEESAKLLEMARDLKSEVDKTTKDMLSVQVVRKAAALEKLAHSVRGK